jgi:cathepsin D
VIASDTVTFASYTIAGKHFGVATSVDSQFQQQPNDGLIGAWLVSLGGISGSCTCITGMCSSVLSNQSTYTFFEDLMNTSMISNPYFSTYLTRGRDSTNQQGTVSGSSLCVGCIATVPSGVQTSGNINYVPITLFAFFEVQMNSISYNGQTISQTSTQAMLDTGTTDIYLPTTVADAMMGKIHGVRQSDGSYLVPASALDTTTTFAFTFSGNVITLDVLDLIDGYSVSLPSLCESSQN